MNRSISKYLISDEQNLGYLDKKPTKSIKGQSRTFPKRHQYTGTFHVTEDVVFLTTLILLTRLDVDPTALIICRRRQDYSISNNAAPGKR